MGGRAREDDPDLLRPDSYYVMGDAGSLYFDDEHADGFETPAEAAEWARGQTLWEYGSELDFSDGVTSVIVLGGEVNAATRPGRSGPTPAPGAHIPRSPCATTPSTSAL